MWPFKKANEDRQTPIVAEGAHFADGEINVSEIEDMYDIVGRAPDGTLLIRKKPNNDSAVQKTLDTALAILWPF